MSKSYLITGGSGYLGHELIKRLDGRIKVVARNEGNLIELKERFPHIEIVTGNIADPYTCQKVCADIDGIFHLAAFKHVGLAEKENVRECVLSNIQGSLNLLEETRKNKPEFIIGISSDKAAQVKGVYGATKFIMERLFAEYENTNPSTKYRIVRYGNVLYSTGSVLCKWRDKLRKGEEIIVTDMDATRFFWTVEEAVDLIFECLDKAQDSTPYVKPMKSIRIGDLLDAMMDKYGKAPIKIIGLQLGENMHEIMHPSLPDSSQVERFTKEEILKVT